MSDRRRAVLAVVAVPGTTERLRPLARELATRVDIRSLDRVVGRPDGLLAASVDALDAAAPNEARHVPLVVWAANATEIAERAAGDREVRAWLSADRNAIERGAIAVSPDAFDVKRVSVVPPLVRARLREREGLAPALVAAVTATGGDSVATLGLAAAAVVTGPLLVSALALGTPTVTTSDEAARLGLRAGQEVEVAEHGEEDDLARAIAADGAWAARLSVGARRFAESTLDLGHIAELVLDQLGLATAQTGVRAAGLPDPLVLLEQRLTELVTPTTAAIRARAATAVACFADRS